MSLTATLKKNIQGDVWPGLPKRFQSFLFFRIQNRAEFKSRLRSFTDNITTAEDACRMSEIIKAAKKKADLERKSARLQALPGVNISFTSTGLEALGAFVSVPDQEFVKRDRKLSPIFRKQQIRGGLFEKGMYSDLVGEGWDNPQELRKEYQPTPEGGRHIDGVIMVTSSLKSDLDANVSKVKQHFLAEAGTAPDADTYTISKNPSIELTLVREGKVRGGTNKGKEHFGFKDGISQPILEGWDERVPQGKEPKATKPGLIVCGHEGDGQTQPAWVKDGSFMVFRDLQQLVPEFNNWMEDNAHLAPFTQDHPKPGEKLAAYMMGRWKNGTPVHESPHDDSDPELFSSNNFDYHPIDEHNKCPFAAHTRKMRPRGDLNHDHAVIVRRGIPYGEDVTTDEANEGKSAADKERGLLFVCYQSDIRNGFNFLTTRWASNHQFPDKKGHVVGEHGPGIDAIACTSPPRSIGLPSSDGTSRDRMPLDSWVVQKGGDYFFVPSIDALRTQLTGPKEIFDQEELTRLREENE
ncbi:hypothetical protein N7493_006020 [Penicillium malachiteum]|uniref:Dyp-type peroxidase n=1 Tax=Penicillium malachiteum TaxID=1324776 RepID=A0AAD6HLH6_9EURO|nr:hypothetical protein N7493_006020 [Penicillium malachiteum]